MWVWMWIGISLRQLSESMAFLVFKSGFLKTLQSYLSVIIIGHAPVKPAILNSTWVQHHSPNTVGHSIFEGALIFHRSLQHLHSRVFCPFHVSLAVGLTLAEISQVVNYSLTFVLHLSTSLLNAINKVSVVNIAIVTLYHEFALSVKLPVWKKALVK